MDIAWGMLTIPKNTSAFGSEPIYPNVGLIGEYGNKNSPNSEHEQHSRLPHVYMMCTRLRYLSLTEDILNWCGAMGWVDVGVRMKRP